MEKEKNIFVKYAVGENLMKTSVSLLFFFCFLSVARINADEIRTWTSASGTHETEAKFVKVSGDGKSVFLLKTDGKEINVPLEKLSVADRTYVQKRRATKKKATSPEKTRPETDNKPKNPADLENVKTVRKTTGRKTRRSALSRQNGEPLSEIDRKAIDNILREFYREHSLPGGVSMAISYRERLVYAGAVGFADKLHEVPLTPKHRMRIASLSKSVTAIAIMKLMEEKKLKLDDEVFGETGIFEGGFGVPTYKDQPAEITVEQLLDHSAGGWSNSGTVDPLVAAARRAVGKELMQIVIREYPLDNAPGTNYDYSNFVYWVLGRVIENKTQMTYEEYVKKHVLAPCGIDGMKIGGKISDPDEVEYIGDNPNFFPMSPMNRDANGGWIANPVELLKLLARIDGFSNVPDILTNKTIKIMTTPSIQNDNYALGWFVNKYDRWWHTGGRPGTCTMMSRHPDGFNYVILMNCTPPAPAEINILFYRAKETVQKWPAGFEL